jgi:hypothetical protein
MLLENDLGYDKEGINAEFPGSQFSGSGKFIVQFIIFIEEIRAIRFLVLLKCE